jgi:hypothetical protein
MFLLHQFMSVLKCYGDDMLDSVSHGFAIFSIVYFFLERNTMFREMSVYFLTWEVGKAPTELCPIAK